MKTISLIFLISSDSGGDIFHFVEDSDTSKYVCGVYTIVSEVVGYAYEGDTIDYVTLNSFDDDDVRYLDSIGVQFKKLNFNDSILVSASRVR